MLTASDHTAAPNLPLLLLCHTLANFTSPTFLALDTLLQFCEYGNVPDKDLELVRGRLFWALDHPDVGIAVLGSWGLTYLLALKPARIFRGKAKFRAVGKMVRGSFCDLNASCESVDCR